MKSIFRRVPQLFAIAALFFLSGAQASVAQNNPGAGNPPGNSPGSGNPPNTTSGGEGLTNPLKVDSLQGFLNAILDGVIQIGTIILIMMLVYVGFLFVAARGNAEKLQSAKSALVWTIIGGLILLGATTIQLVITGTVESIRTG
ncbi:MAG: pilin [Patescibacteria group bacterium]